MAAPRTFNKEAETRKVSPDFLFSASSSASSICQGDLHAGPDLLALFDPDHYHRHHPPPHLTHLTTIIVIMVTKVIYMLILIMAVFFLCWTPILTYNLLAAFELLGFGNSGRKITSRSF